MDVRIAEAVRLIERDMSEVVCFDAVAGQVGLSPSRFHHLFRDTVGVPPGAYLRRIRLDAAALRLQWTSEPARLIAIGLGYDSHASFTQAFRRRFGTSPGRFREDYGLQAGGAQAGGPGAEGGLGAVSVREVPGFRLLARRYVGDLWEVRRFWIDFCQRLPGGMGRWRNALFLGLVHDDPRTTPPGEARYDCCVTLPEAVPAAVFAGAGLQLVETRAGRYGSLRFAGSRERVPDAYRLLCDQWARNSRFTITDDPAIEIHSRPRHHMDPDRLSLTLLLGVE